MTGAVLLKAQVLFATHGNDVFRYLCRIVGQSEATDLTQEVFLRVARSAVPDPHSPRTSGA
jgi:DNA-directed RNA polymerase specialized sigma24 family protein